MKQIDLEPGEFEIVLIGREDLPPPPSAFEIATERFRDNLNQSYEQIARSFIEFGESLRHMAPLWHRMPVIEEPPPRERHHIQFIERHIRKTRKPRK